MILVTGATGHVGGELVRHLAAAREPVRAMTRGAVGVAFPAAVEIATGDLDRPESLPTALQDVRAVFLLGGFQDMSAVMAQIRTAGVEHVVLLSSRCVEGGSPSNAVVAMHERSEDAVRTSGVPYTILRASGFMSNTLEWIPQLRAGDVVRAPFAAVPIAAIDPFDIGAVAALLLTTSRHAEQPYVLTGPRAIVPSDRVRALASVLGRALRFEAQPNDDAKEEMLRSIPVKYVDAFFRFFVDGEFDDSAVVPTVPDLLGRPARGIEDWARAHAAAFGGNATAA